MWNSYYAAIYEPDHSKGPQEPRPLPEEPKPIPLGPVEHKPIVAPYAPKVRPVDFFDDDDAEDLF